MNAIASAGQNAQNAAPNTDTKTVEACPEDDPVLQEHYQALDTREKELLALREAEANPDKLVSIERRLSEVRGERAAAEKMSQDGYRMAKGYSRGGRGIDQIWVKPSNVDVNILQPTPDEIAIVEAKGGSATLSQEERYVNDTGGCYQMDEDWVQHNAIKMAKKVIHPEDPEKARLEREQKVGEKVFQAIASGELPPHVAGIVIQNGTPVPAADLPGTVKPDPKNGKIPYNYPIQS